MPKGEAAIEYVSRTHRFEDLYVCEYSLLVALGTALTGNRCASEDLVQDTMVKAYVRWSWLEKSGRPGAWCHRVLVNSCRGWWRRQRIEQRFVQLASRQFEESEPGANDDVVLFWDVVRRLPERPRAVVALYYVGQYTTVELATILAVPEGTVRSDLSRARAWLAGELGMTS